MSERRSELIFRVFVSSTFDDLVSERNALESVAFPALREYCEERGARFQPIDLRWGVSDEAFLDQQAIPICLQEIARCQDVSPRPNFIVLLGQRYGARPLPAYVKAEEFETILETLEPRDVEHIRKWYRRDDNALRPEYSLLAREGEYRDKGVWEAEEAKLRAILQKGVEATPTIAPRERSKYFQSATHQEIEHGALHPATNAHSHVFAYFRTITNAPEEARARGFIDGGDRASLDALKLELEERLPEENIYKYDCEWKDDGPTTDLQALAERVRSDLEKIIDEELTTFARRSEFELERDAHDDFGKEWRQHFVGRVDQIDRIREYVRSDERTPLVLHGTAGSGKTALMSQASSEVKAERSLVRFIGATPGSSDLRSLLHKLCRELGADSPPTDMNELVSEFRNLVSERRQEDAESGYGTPVQTVVFLDALDQLNESDNARSLYWLPRKLAAGVKLVASVVEDDQDGSCFDLAKRIWPDSLLRVESLELDVGETLLNNWLEAANRTLQDQQRARVLSQFQRDRTPLFLKLAFEEAQRWKSWDVTSSVADSIEAILDDFFHRLERDENHGKPIVAAALSYIATAKSGLTEDELLDLLSKDDAVMSYFYDHAPAEQAKTPKARTQRLPVVVWARLHSDLEPYLTQRRADGTVVLDFYHQQVATGVVRRYLTGEESMLNFHVRLAEYFDGLDFWLESIEEQRARARRLPPTPRPANIRKVVELPYHRIEAAKVGGKDDPKSPLWDAVADLLLNWQFLEAKTEADPYFDFERDRALAKRTSEGEGPS